MGRPREFDEDGVLTAAREQFWSTGFAGTSMETIAAATGLGKGSLYGAFGGKRELFHRVFDDYCTAAVGSAAHRLDGDDEQAFERLTTYFLDHARTSAEPGHRACLLAKGAAELAEHDEVVSARSLAAFEELRRTFTAVLEACQRNGDVDPGADAPRLAGLLLTVHRGIEAVGEAGARESVLREGAQAALDGLPRPPGRAAGPARGTTRSGGGTRPGGGSRGR
ncbi:AcrR family transcriptional regulator [Kineococcus radiotolerans]|uniref:AcrR family transcriptional regulator n=1 Tax=Kineococcus radiotolerans TaxID=131568 RepID=A0A7W4XWX1_KINRA|nr:TetR/AcrR family transcriptional regulator [Kineococcus radiotolerans]MBB2900872.1 AcrR family transcriptional regulator [Kineococcus radiotolerans]